MLRSPLPILLALTALAAARAQDPESAPGDRYPAVRHETVVRFYNLKGKLDAGALNTALRAASLESACGPLSASSRPNNHMVAVSVPADMKSKEVERVLRKAKLKSEALEAFVFDGRVENGFPSFGLGLTKLDYMLGMSGDIRWCEMFETSTVFYCVAGKLDAAKIEDLWRKLQNPLGTEEATLGEVVTEPIEWQLPEEVDERRAKKLVKAIAKLEGIATVEFAGDRLTGSVRLAELSLFGPARGELTGREALRGSVCTNALWDLLVKEGLRPVGE